MAAVVEADDAEMLAERRHLAVPHRVVGAERVQKQERRLAIVRVALDIEFPIPSSIAISGITLSPPLPRVPAGLSPAGSMISPWAGSASTL